MQVQNSSSKLDNIMVENSPVQAIQSWMVSKLSEQLSLDAKTIEIGEQLTRYGVDSIDAVTLVGDLEDWLEVELPSTLFWDYPTIEKAAEYLVQEFDVSAVLNSGEPEKVVAANTQPEKAEKKGWGGLFGKK
ncbi:MAG TPA: phosphopantetheine-binding protein [Cyanobacteria bacterium UBA11149]|nr:phosphopantetheine-binding protein [Cyanobacteria bacterium UBA11367]HBE59244.1 phosphopantetheine-binding protein [Cyanobacteria bacterium UBA11366]HBK62930.1 phosphopantetheine-binding protein [Cyanobacteria bacterium UBA11166]HBR76866.1 phosphopantetheine-binding protein [Cyanobacteria bacterium UBA11159]HBS69135.1 phosphopantetheine-binding protein [Cyanobacteria bacterium UBA11153]HBW88270.1 phosphopantetheine-binding protein [Cyanobacteria bacterium UBA11149]HCA97132.1 phosphopanteth